MTEAITRCRRCGFPAMAMQMRGQWTVECNNDGTLGKDVVPCGAVGPTEATKADAISAWNEGNTPPVEYGQ